MTDPASMVLYFEESIESENRTIDLSQCASIVNRRFYRQGLEWAVAGIRFTSSAPITVTACTLPQTWVTANAWTKAFSIWKKWRSETTLEDNPSLRAKYSDFKVYMDQEQIPGNATGVTAANWLPHGFLSNETNAYMYDWDYSELQAPYVDPATGLVADGGKNWALFMVGDDDPAANPTIGVDASKGIISGYADTRARAHANDPNVPTTSANDKWMIDLFDDGHVQSQAELLIENENEDTPYVVGRVEDLATGNPTQEYYPGGGRNANLISTHAVGATSIYASSGVVSEGNGFIPGFTAPCGLVRLRFNGSGYIRMWIDLVPGNHRGYMARPMGEMN